MTTDGKTINGHEVMRVTVIKGRRYFFTRDGIYREVKPRRKKPVIS